MAQNQHPLGGNDGGQPVGDNARKGAVRKRSQLKLGGATAWTKRSDASGEFMAVKRPAKKTPAGQVV
jgi:hypothetical protein